LARHRSRELINERIEHVLSIVPQTTPDEVLSTVLHACRALRATASDAYELIGFTTANATLAALETEFVSNGWLER
jgi:uroporphyrinogen-III decarboxylase